MSSELKTLKDFQVEGLSSYTVLQICKEIKQEAIKWVKQADKLETIAIKNDNSHGTIFHGSAKLLFMKFFNITSEDLI